MTQTITHDIEKINQLADFLDQLPDPAFDIYCFTRVSTPPPDRDKGAQLRRAAEFLRKGAVPECGAVGCAIGWCPVVFPELEWDAVGAVVNRDTGDDGFDAVQKLLGLKAWESTYAFVFNSYPMDEHNVSTCGPKDVARRLRLLAENQYEAFGIVQTHRRYIGMTHRRYIGMTPGAYADVDPDSLRAGLDAQDLSNP
jgi:hypothetical protein